ncbi:MAG: hypothetical protein WCC90_20620, partial [Methylocella sp.]
NPIRQQDNPELSALHLIDPRPPTNSIVCLHRLPLPGCDDVLNPFGPEYRAVGKRANCLKILRNFHSARYLVARGVSFHQALRRSVKVDVGPH